MDRLIGADSDLQLWTEIERERQQEIVTDGNHIR